MTLPHRRLKRFPRKPVFLASRRRRRQRLWRWLVCLTLLGLVILPSIHWANRLVYQQQRELASPFLQPLPLSQLGKQVVIIAPHPDDETLGCAGLIQRLKEAGASPFVLVVTQGDGFDAAIHLKLREVRIKPEDRERFVRLREQETLSAMRLLGLSPKQVAFLGLSERTLAADWLLKGDDTPLRQLAHWLERLQPTTVILPSRYDDHPIHSVVCSIGWASLLHLEAEGRLPRPLILEVLIHYGEFPRPQGLYPQLELFPPTDLLPTARWFTLSLSSEELEKKWAALKCYRTQQLPLTWRFLKSFVRRNEIFAAPLPLLVQPDRIWEPRSFLTSLDIAQVSVFLPSQTHLTTSRNAPLQVALRVRGRAIDRFQYGIHVWSPKQPTRSLPLLPTPNGELVASLPPSYGLPAVITAFTGYREHILDVAPIIVDGVDHEPP